jgi:hypothetical protein
LSRRIFAGQEAKTMQIKPSVPLLAAAFLLFGCKSPSPPAPTPSTAAPQPVTDACAVLVPGEIGAALGVPIDPGKHTIATSNIMCDWSQTGATGDKAVKLVLNFSSLDAFNREKAATSNVKIASAPGIGDEAFYVTTEFGTSLLIRKGKTSIGFSVRNLRMPVDKVKAGERTLGLAAAARI